MRHCVWLVQGRRYATPAHDIDEVVPVVAVRPMDHAPPWVRGLMDYRGTLMVLIDAAMLLGHAAQENRMAGRILILRLQDHRGQRRCLGLQVEYVSELAHLDFDDDGDHPGLQVSQAEYLGPVAHTPHGTVQLVDVQHLLTAEQRAILFERQEKK